jgi:hypothetical protein
MESVAMNVVSRKSNRLSEYKCYEVGASECSSVSESRTTSECATQLRKHTISEVVKESEKANERPTQCAQFEAAPHA